MIWAAAAVHAFTACGAVAAMFAAFAIFDHNAERVFFWLAVALFIDGIDGTFARAVGVRQRLPRYSGEILDLVVDYVTYVFVPVLALVAWQKLAGSAGIVLAAGALLSSLYHFADTESKDADYRFLGFPALWNVVAFYVFALGLSPGQTAILSAVCIAGAFYPVPWPHPLRVKMLRPLTLAILVAGSAAGMYALYTGLPAGPGTRTVLVLSALYALALTLYWTVAERHRG